MAFQHSWTLWVRRTQPPSAWQPTAAAWPSTWTPSARSQGSCWMLGPTCTGTSATAPARWAVLGFPPGPVWVSGLAACGTWCERAFMAVAFEVRLQPVDGLRLALWNTKRMVTSRCLYKRFVWLWWMLVSEILALWNTKRMVTSRCLIQHCLLRLVFACCPCVVNAGVLVWRGEECNGGTVGWGRGSACSEHACTFCRFPFKGELKWRCKLGWTYIQCAHASSAGCSCWCCQ